MGIVVVVVCDGRRRGGGVAVGRESRSGGRGGGGRIHLLSEAGILIFQARCFVLEAEVRGLARREKGGTEGEWQNARSFLVEVLALEVVSH